MNSKHKTALAATMAALLGAAGAAHAEFQGRDATGAASSTCTATGPNKCTYFYDTTLDITILNNWNIGLGPWSPSAAPGSAQAIAASAGHSASGLTGWVLPTGPSLGGPFVTNQFQSIWTSAGSSFAGLSGQFDGAVSTVYWTSSPFLPIPGAAWYIQSFDGNFSFLDGGTTRFPAVAVRPGDIAAVPEPQTYALMLMGVGALLLAKRRRWL
jgi:hypothetical protein